MDNEEFEKDLGYICYFDDGSIGFQFIEPTENPRIGVPMMHVDAWNLICLARINNLLKKAYRKKNLPREMQETTWKLECQREYAIRELRKSPFIERIEREGSL